MHGLSFAGPLPGFHLATDPLAAARLSLGYVAAVSGDAATAHEILGGLEAGDAEHSSFLAATILAALGDTDRAFDRLERAFGDREWRVTMILIHPWLEPLRGDPRFEATVRRLGFPER